MKRYLGILPLILSGYSSAGGWTEPLTVETVFTEGATDLIVIQSSGGSQSVSGCVINNWIFVADNENRRNRGYSTAMAALASGKKYQFGMVTHVLHGRTTVPPQLSF